MNRLLDVEKATVKISLGDYQRIQREIDNYYNLLKELCQLVYIDQITSENIIVVIKKEEVKKLLIPYAASDCELDDFEEDGVKNIVIWK